VTVAKRMSGTARATQRSVTSYGSLALEGVVSLLSRLQLAGSGEERGLQSVRPNLSLRSAILWAEADQRSQHWDCSRCGCTRILVTQPRSLSLKHS